VVTVSVSVPVQRAVQPPSLPAEISTTEKRRAVPVLALSPDEAAAALGVSRDYLDDHIAHELRWVRRGRRKIVAVAELERWLAEAAARTVGARR
jgi:excisionase family DNA binding protein